MPNVIDRVNKPSVTAQSGQVVSAAWTSSGVNLVYESALMVGVYVIRWYTERILGLMKAPISWRDEALIQDSLHGRIPTDFAHSI